MRDNGCSVDGTTTSNPIINTIDQILNYIPSGIGIVDSNLNGNSQEMYIQQQALQINHDNAYQVYIYIVCNILYH